MTPQDPFFVQKGSIFAIPVIHYKMEFASRVFLAFQQIRPDCVAVELPETIQTESLHAAARLPDISVIVSEPASGSPLYYMSEPCDSAFEALRCASEKNVPAFCIDLDVDDYPEIYDPLPDAYAIERIGLKEYYEVYKKAAHTREARKHPLDKARELHMARRLKELSLRYDRVLFITGMTHLEDILHFMDYTSFPPADHAERKSTTVCTLTEDSCFDLMAECGWMAKHYEERRQEMLEHLRAGRDTHGIAFPPDRQKLLYQLYKSSSEVYKTTYAENFPGYHFRNLMKFVRNYALVNEQLMPDLYQILMSAKGCVDHNYAYETWQCATEYPYRLNVDALPELDLSIEDVWGDMKPIRFYLKQPSRKGGASPQRKRKKQDGSYRFSPSTLFGICSHQPEDIAVERFGDFLKKKGNQIFSEEGARTVPFSSSLEDGIDTRETIRHWPERKLYVKKRGKPPGGVGSIVVIFDQDEAEKKENSAEKFPWCTTWLGEHEQESDMAFYATRIGENLVGPGISRCKYGGFLLSYPPRRMFDVWQDPDYESCRSKSETLLMAGIDYAVKPIVVYVADKPPHSSLKAFAAQFGKRIVYIPLGQLSPLTLKKIQTFHVLDGRDKREIAGDYIF